MILPEETYDHLHQIFLCLITFAKQNCRGDLNYGKLSQMIRRFNCLSDCLAQSIKLPFGIVVMNRSTYHA